jgi:hypothetical protein
MVGSNRPLQAGRLVRVADPQFLIGRLLPGFGILVGDRLREARRDRIEIGQAEGRAVAEICVVVRLGDLAVFLTTQPATNRAFWARFNDAFDDSDAECAILGIEAPHQHWIVVTRHRGRLLFTDSAAGQPYELRDQNTLYAGERRRRASDWLVAKQELALFHH